MLTDGITNRPDDIDERLLRVESEAESRPEDERTVKELPKIKKQRKNTKKLLEKALYHVHDHEGKEYDRFEIEGETITVTKASERNLHEIGHFEKDHYKVGKPYTEKEYRTHVFPIGEIFMLKNEAGKLIGLTSVSYGPASNKKIKLDNDDAYFMGSVLVPEMQGKGISRHINKIREDCARTKGMKRIFTIVRPANLRSLKALTKSGFRVVENRPNMMPQYGDDDGSRLIMVKDLK